MVKDLTKSLSDAISSSIRASKFCCGGTIPQSDPGIEVKDVGVLKFPLKPKAVKSLVEQCQIAPFGKGTKTLVDTKVRKTYELSPDRFCVSDEWTAKVADVVAGVASELGLPPDKLQPELYKLLVYKEGGFFVPHRDSEKNDGMVASLIIALPNEFRGGALIVRHPPSQEMRFPFEEAANGNVASYAAFYADCEHEVRRVERGVRVCLCYNLTLRPSKTARGKRKSGEQDGNPLAASVRSWFAVRPSAPLVFALEHQYTERGLSGSLLKGVDRSLADLVTSVAEEADCQVHLAHVSRHLCQFADDGSFQDWDRYGRRSRSRTGRKLEIGETYEDELLGTQWTNLSGKKQPWGDLPLELTSIVSEIPIDGWKPTSEEYEGYTGNAGNTLDRWYHRTAVVIWPTSQHYNVLASAGHAVCIPLFLKLMSKLARAAKYRKESVRSDCIAFARAIISNWPTVYERHRQTRVQDDTQSLLDQFRDQLVTLNDRETIVELLSQVASRDQTLGLKALIQHACREFGLPSIAAGLQALLTPPHDLYRRIDLPVRNVEWLAAVCELSQKDDVARDVARDLCRKAVSWFCVPIPRQRYYGYRDDARTRTTAEAALPRLLKALLNCDCSNEVASVIQFVESNPGQFTLEHGHVPTLIKLVPWSLKRFGRIPEPIQDWLTQVRQQLETATALEPQPPADWTHPSDVSCQCRFCDQLSAFLRDPTAEVGRIPAREDIRSHLIQQISQQQFDVTHTIEKLKSPYSLVLTKTQDSFQRTLKRYQLDTNLLATLPKSE
ncbi:MAG: 2OG-Fe(II) oxygenase [Planctomycetaceae bacterium]